MSTERPAPILSMRQLAWTIRVPIEQLKALADSIQRDPRQHYDHFSIEIGKDKYRQIDHPKAELKNVQRRLLHHVLVPMGFGEAAHGGISGRSPTSNAKVHQGQRCVVKMDVKTFFPSVQHNRVYRMFRHEYGFGEDVSRLLTRLVTLRERLPQGAATSTAVANLFARSIDERLKPSLQRHGLTCTRFIDDITISGDRPKVLIALTKRLLKAKGLQHHPDKLKVCPRGGPQEVTGVLVNHAERLSLPKAYRDGVRSAIHKLRSTPRHEWPKQIASIEGKIAHIARFRHDGVVARLRRNLATVLAEAK
jgi:RNA-directed DNA polymerase